MRNILMMTLLVCCLWHSQWVQAQQPPRDYKIVNIDRRFSNDGASFTVEIVVTNGGGDAQVIAPVSVVRMDDGRVLASDMLQPLTSGAVQALSFDFMTVDYEPGMVLALRVEVGIDQFELAGSPIAADNSRSISVQIPGGDVVAPAEAESTPEPAPAASALDLDFLLSDEDLTLAGWTISRVDLAIYLGIGLAGLIILYLLLRLLFRSPPTFDVWQPPYANVPPLDPNSDAGRRQGWQLHAQNGLILATCTPGAVHVIKLLQDTAGTPLGGWHITGLRLSQYDMYGRVARSQVIASRGLVRKLDKIVHKSPQLTGDELENKLRSVTRSLLTTFRRRIKPASAMLPVALDMRLQGLHGEVRIVFELYECQIAGWHRIDSWEPEMTVLDRAIKESCTFTVHGQGPGEDQKAYIERLENDIIWLLLETLRAPQRSQATVPVETVPPDTLTGMTPIRGA